jgi:transcriptional regulator with XRE-family HTH domain
MTTTPTSQVRLVHQAFLQFRGRLLQIARHDRGYRVDALARKTGFDARTIRLVELGQCEASPAFFDAVAAVLDVPVNRINPYVDIL